MSSKCVGLELLPHGRISELNLLRPPDKCRRSWRKPPGPCWGGMRPRTAEGQRTSEAFLTGKTFLSWGPLPCGYELAAEMACGGYLVRSQRYPGQGEGCSLPQDEPGDCRAMSLKCHTRADMYTFCFLGSKVPGSLYVLRERVIKAPLVWRNHAA